jgi:calcineurin-like phosphoesterase family protein
MCNRPYNSVEEMDEKLISNWNKTISKNSIVWFLGDFTLSRKVETFDNYMSQLNGTINFIIGNHDNYKTLRKSKYLNNVVSNKHILKYYEYTITLCHYSLRTWNKGHYGTYHLHGHSHGSLNPLGKSVDIGVDSPFIAGLPLYRPFSFDEVNNYLKTRPIEVVDKHETKK